jgi:hypothetical protein
LKKEKRSGGIKYEERIEGMEEDLLNNQLQEKK